MKRRDASIAQNYKGLFKEWEVAIAVKLVREEQRRWPCLARDDEEDLIQECLIHWDTAKRGYNPARGATERTYMATVLRNKLADLRDQRAADIRRANFEADSLDEPVGDGEDATRGDLLDPASVVDAPNDAYLVIPLRAILSRVLSTLTPRQRRLWQLRLNGYSTKKASEMLDISRDTAYEDIKRMRSLFEKAGLRDYLK